MAVRLPNSDPVYIADKALHPKTTTDRAKIYFRLFKW
jgi:hypothetical protein